MPPNQCPLRRKQLIPIATTFTNRDEAQAYLRDVLKTEPDLSENVDLDALTDDFHQIAGGSWDFQHIAQELSEDTEKIHNNAYLAVVKPCRPLIRGRFFIPVSGSMRSGVLEQNDDNTVW